MRLNSITLLALAVTILTGAALFAPKAEAARFPNPVTSAACAGMNGTFTSTGGVLGWCDVPDTTSNPNVAYQSDTGVANRTDFSNGSKQLECDQGVPECLAVIIYTIGPSLASKVAYVGAYFFSIMVKLSLNSTAYALQFLSDGWTTVRDLANMAFIFILIYTAMVVMLRAETADTIKTLASVIVIALLVNFSFFFTRVTIDTGNILALQFYNAIPSDGVIEGPQIKDLSTSIMGAVKPQVLLGTDTFQKARNAAGDSRWGALGVFAFIYIAMAVMLWMLFFAFIQVGIKFLLRIVGLWFVLISSPLAFVARTIKHTQKFFTEWLKMLVQFSVYPAIFLFMFLMLTKFASSILTSNTTMGGDFFQSMVNTLPGATQNGAAQQEAAIAGISAAIASVAIRMGFILALLYVALRVSDWIVKQGSDIAGRATDWVGNLTNGAVRYGPGWAAGAAYRNTVARGANAASKAVAGSQWANRPGTFGGLVGYRLNKNVLKPMTETSLGTVASTYKDRQAFLEKRKDELEGNLKNIAAKKDGARLAEIEKTWDTEEATLKTLRSNVERGIVLDPPAQRNLKRLEELNTERSILVKRVDGFSSSQISSLKASDIEGIIKQISDSHLKAIKESKKYSNDELKSITAKWQELNKKSPLGESQKQLDELTKIRDILKAKHPAFDVAGLNKLVDTAVGKEVNLRSIEEAKKQVTEAKEAQETIRDDYSRRATPTGRAEITTAGQRAKELKKAEEKLEKLAEKIKDVPEKTGGVAAPAAFNRKA